MPNAAPRDGNHVPVAAGISSTDPNVVVPFKINPVTGRLICELVTTLANPGNSVVSETSFGQSSAAGSSTDYSRTDHTHGTPEMPTASDIGLGNVDNTSDADKPISDDTATALSLKEDISNKVTSMGPASTDSEYASAKATYDAIQDLDVRKLDVTGLGWMSADFRASSNTVLSGEQTIDGVLTSSSTVLLRSQSNPAENGIWITSAWAWSRHPDCNTSRDIIGKNVSISRGTSFSGRYYKNTNNADIIIGTTAIAYSEVFLMVGGSPTAISSSQTLSGSTIRWGRRHTVSTASWPITVTMPATSSINGSGWFNYITKTTADANPVTIAAGSGQTINGAASIQLTVQYETVCMFYDTSLNFTITSWYKP